MFNNHKALRNILQSKGFVIIGEFGCKGFSHYVLKLFKGKRLEMNKNSPTEEDIKNAEKFAEKLLGSI
jgi:flavodoxin